MNPPRRNPVCNRRTLQEAEQLHSKSISPLAALEVALTGARVGDQEQGGSKSRDYK